MCPLCLCGYNPCQLLDNRFHFLFVILTIEDIPLSAAFRNGALLAFDLVPGCLIDFFFFFEPLCKDVHDGETDGIPVLDEFDGVDRGELVADLVSEQIDLLAA